MHHFSFTAFSATSSFVVFQCERLSPLKLGRAQNEGTPACNIDCRIGSDRFLQRLSRGWRNIVADQLLQ
jgi:hypothetical protein